MSQVLLPKLPIFPFGQKKKALVLPMGVDSEVAGIRVLADGTWYNVYPEGQQTKSSSGTIVVAYGAKNIGIVDGNLYGRILKRTSIIHDGQEQWCHVGDIIYWEPTLNMPAYSINLLVQVANNREFVNASEVSFTVASTEEIQPPFPGLPSEINLPGLLPPLPFTKPWFTKPPWNIPFPLPYIGNSV